MKNERTRKFSGVPTIGGNLTAQSTGSHRRIAGGIQIPETKLQDLFPFLTPPPEHSGELARRIQKKRLKSLTVYIEAFLT